MILHVLNAQMSAKHANKIMIIVHSVNFIILHLKNVSFVSKNMDFYKLTINVLVYVEMVLRHFKNIVTMEIR